MKLFKHQAEGIAKAIKTNGISALFWDVGVGKSLAALKIYEHYKAITPDLKLFIICPISLIESTWIEEIKKYTKFSSENLRNSQNLSADIFIINYETLISKKFKGTLARIILYKNLMCVLDESQRAKSYNSITAKYLLSLSKYLKYKIILSATPAPNNELEYWSQLTFLDTTILGSNYFSFRNRYFCLNRGESNIPLAGLGRKEMLMMMQRGYKMQVLPDMKRMLTEKLSVYCQFLNKRDVLDLPDEIDEYREVEMTKEQAKAYKEMFKDLITEIEGETISVDIALAKIMKVRQVTGGFIYNNEGKAVQFKINPKMNELKEVLNEIGNKKVIIFCQYKWEIETIAKEYGEDAVTLYGATGDKEASIKAFKENAKYLVCHPLSAGVGLSFNDCDYMIFYSLDYSYMNYYQCRGRIMRAGKKNNATYIHIVAKNSIDGVILNVLKNKGDNNKLFQEIIKNA